MKALVLVLLLGLALSSVGCTATPAYSGQERAQLISRNMNYEGAQISDDVDTLLLLRPAGRLTIWNVR